MRRRRRARWIGACAVGAALVLGACGDDDGSGGSASGDASDGSGFTGAGSDAFCEAFRELEASGVFDGDPDFSDPEAVRAQYESFQDRLTELQAVASEEITDDVTTIRTSLVDLVTLLDEYDYDLEAIRAAATGDPDLAARVEAFGDPALEDATARLDTYSEQVCGITPGTTG